MVHLLEYFCKQHKMTLLQRFNFGEASFCFCLKLSVRAKVKRHPLSVLPLLILGDLKYTIASNIVNVILKKELFEKPFLF